MNDQMQNWKGYPLRCWPNHQDDCYRWDWEIQIDGKWLEVVTQSTRWMEDEARAQAAEAAARPSGEPKAAEQKSE